MPVARYQARNGSFGQSPDHSPTRGLGPHSLSRTPAARSVARSSGVAWAVLRPVRARAAAAARSAAVGGGGGGGGGVEQLGETTSMGKRFLTSVGGSSAPTPSSAHQYKTSTLNRCGPGPRS